MDKLFEFAPEILREAAGSHLGILALLCLALSVLAYLFFRSASERLKAGIFVLLFAGVAAFAAAILQVPVTVAPPSTPVVPQMGKSTDRPSESQHVDRWYVVVASVQDVDSARQKVEEAKAKGFPNAEYLLQSQSKAIAVIVGKNLLRAEAEQLRESARSAGLAPDTFLWPHVK